MPRGGVRAGAGRKRTNPDLDSLINEEIKEILSACEEKGLSPIKISLHLFLRVTLDTLSKYPPSEQKYFAMRVMDKIFYEPINP